MSKKIKCFISYSHKDKRMLDKFLVHFKSLTKLVDTENWYDGMIPAGGNIDEEIKKAFNKSDVIFLLISPDYINSYYCYEKELTWAIERHNKKKCIVIPVILKEYVSGNYPFSHLKFVPSDGRAINRFKPQNSGYVDAFNSIKSLLENFSSLSSITPEKPSNKIKYEIVSNDQVKSVVLTPLIFKKLIDYQIKQAHFYADMNVMFNEYIDRFRADYNVRENREQKDKRYLRDIQEFLFQLSTYIQKHLIGYNTCLHFRIKKHRQQKYKNFYEVGYTKLGLSTEPIVAKGGIIDCAKRHHLPVIMSKNKSLHQYSHPKENIKRDYIAFVFENLKSKYNIDLTLCISVIGDLQEDDLNTLIAMAINRFDIYIDKFIIQFLNTCVQIDRNLNIKAIFENGVN